MPLIADNFLAGSIISLLFPVGLLIAVALWYGLAVRRMPDTPQDSPASPAAPEPATPPGVGDSPGPASAA